MTHAYVLFAVCPTLLMLSSVAFLIAVRSSAAANLLGALAYNTTLVALDLSHNGLDGSVGLVVARRLGCPLAAEMLTGLTALNISSNPLGVDAASCIFESVAGNR